MWWPCIVCVTSEWAEASAAESAWIESIIRLARCGKYGASRAVEAATSARQTSLSPMWKASMSVEIGTR